MIKMAMILCFFFPFLIAQLQLEETLYGVVLGTEQNL
jgi:hypothetical protein